jgi:hypothetical protein
MAGGEGGLAVSGFLRPEAARTLARWQEVLAALCVIGLGLWIAAAPGPIVRGFGFVLIAGGALALVPAIRRARFATTGEGAGVVRIDEGRILYMGPHSGGTVAVQELHSLALRTDHLGGRAWVLTEPGQMLVIPVDAAGADALFDAFAALPGLAVRDILRALETPGEGTKTLWRRSTGQALTR